MTFEGGRQLEGKESSFEETFSFESRIKTIDAAEDLARTHLQELGWPEDKIERFALSVHEAVSNAVVHGNLGVSKTSPDDTSISERALAAEKTEKSSKKVTIVFKFTKDRAEAEIIDEGDFLPAKGLSSEFREGDISTSGRGIGLIGLDMSELEFSPGRIRFALERKDGDNF